jgi:hypothetical protein
MAYVSLPKQIFETNLRTSTDVVYFGRYSTKLLIAASENFGLAIDPI